MMRYQDSEKLSRADPRPAIQRYLRDARIPALLLLLPLLLVMSNAWAAKPPPVIPDVEASEVIGFALYTVQDETLKITAQLYPLPEDAPRTVRLELQSFDGTWSEAAATDVVMPGWTAPFRIENWDASRNIPYRIRHGEEAVYEGLIRKDPVDKEEIVVAAFTGNSNADRRLKPDIIRNVKAIDPDMLFFSGDQSYDHKDHLAAWLLWGRQFGEVIKNRPTIAIPDDHDVGQGNIWGAGGRPTDVMEEGGYMMPPDYVNEVQRAQTSHLPDPFDPTPVLQDIGVYYTRLQVGRVDFAIIEDRKWKTGPRQAKKLKEPDTPVLLGKRQLDFLRYWAHDWEGTDMKAVLSQTIFVCADTGREITPDPIQDHDSNGWPADKRNQALRLMRQGFSFHIAGDTHLSTVTHQGIDEWEDAAVSFAVPSIVNYWSRYWRPQYAPVEAMPGDLPNLGRYRDGFGNRLTMRAYINPAGELKNMEHRVERDDPMHGADGFGVVRFNKRTRDITMESYPRLVDVTQSGKHQYPGWPVTVNQLDNYKRLPAAWLPEISLDGAKNAVFQVLEESSGKLLYSLRSQGQHFQPWVFAAGNYTLRIGEHPDSMKTLSGLKATKNKSEAGSINVVLGPQQNE